MVSEPAGEALTGTYPELARVASIIADGDVERGLQELVDVILAHDPDVAPRAMLMYAMFQERLNHFDAAATAYGWAIDSGHDEVAPFVAQRLAQILLAVGDERGARTFLAIAVAARDPEVRASAEEALRALGPRRRWWQRFS